MSKLTDPAKELSDIASKLATGSGARGDQHLAEKFGVALWSTNFVKIIACIHERIDLVAEIVAAADLDEDTRDNALAHLEGFRAGFQGDSLRNSWNTSGQGVTAMTEHGKPIQFFSWVRSVVAYPQLSPTEVEELLKLIDAYLAELAANEDEPEFVRRSIAHGVKALRFQLEYLSWMGAAYLLAAFRELVLVYEVSAQEVGNRPNLDSRAALLGLGSVLKAVKEKFDQAKGWADSADWAFQKYQQVSAVVLPLLLTYQQRPGG